MSKRELDRLELIGRIERKELSVISAAERMGLSRSQVHRLMCAYRERGSAALISARRGKPSNRTLPDHQRELAVAIITERYADFGPTLATEKLAELHELHVSKETVRKWMIEAGLWKTKAARRRIYQPRNRRDCLGELVQIDGSLHHWFEGRGPKCSLLVFIDDATGRIQHLRFCPSESTFDYMAAFRTYVTEHGKPIAFYSDKHTIFRTPKPARKGNGDHGGRSQFGRTLHELNVDIICANTPQAKGRVERANRTLQDRLVKELRLCRASRRSRAANVYGAPICRTRSMTGLPSRQSNPKDMHRPLAAYDSLDGAMCVKHQRTVSNSAHPRYDQVLFILEPNKISDRPRSQAGDCLRLSGRPPRRSVTASTYLPYTTFDK